VVKLDARGVWRSKKSAGLGTAKAHTRSWCSSVLVVEVGGPGAIPQIIHVQVISGLSFAVNASPSISVDQRLQDQPGLAEPTNRPWLSYHGLVVSTS
jgi:hypothetical protein